MTNLDNSFTLRSLTTAHSPKQPAVITTTFLNFRGGRLRELRLYQLLLMPNQFPEEF